MQRQGYNASVPSVVLDEVELYYEEAGPVDAPAVLLLHGFSASSAMWAFQRAPLAERYRVIAPDARGHGRTRTVGRERLSLGRSAADALALLDRLGIAKTHVVGLTMGGMVAQELVLAAPERVDALVLCDTLAGPLPAPLLLAAATLPLAAEIRAVREVVHRRWISRMGGGGAAQLSDVARSMTSHDDLRGMLRAGRALVAKPDRRRDLARISHDTLVLVGENDALFNGSIVLHARLPRARLAVLERCGHGSAVWRPRTFNRVLLDFLADPAAFPPGTARYFPKSATRGGIEEARAIVAPRPQGWVEESRAVGRRVWSQLAPRRARR